MAVQFLVQVQSFRFRQRLPLRGSWQSRQALTEGVRSQQKKLPLSGELDANEVSRLRGPRFLVFRRDILSEILFAQGL